MKMRRESKEERSLRTNAEIIAMSDERGHISPQKVEREYAEITEFFSKRRGRHRNING